MPATTTFTPNFTIRPYQIGDIGWAIEQHGRLYADEYGFNGEFEALVATLFAKFATQHDAACEQMWVAEANGERVGCVFLIRNADDPQSAQIRCLIVTPQGRGLGVGRALLAQCLSFAKQAGYPHIMLWTNAMLHAARHLYEQVGFELVSEEAHHSFGQDMAGQIWRRAL
ncbi:MAG: GNAT family N-acetyltransferase [Burkholderiaceae bacterium]